LHEEEPDAYTVPIANLNPNINPKPPKLPMHLATIALLLPLLLLPSLLSSTPSTTPSTTPDTALADLEAMHEILQTHTPGAVDKQNPQYRAWMKEGLKKAQQIAKSHPGPAGHLAALRTYASGFEDEHIRILSLSDEGPWTWPGFSVTYLNEQWIVQSSTIESQIQPGDELISLEGQPISEVLINDIFPLHQGVPTLQADRTTLTPYLLLRRENSLLTPPKQLIFTRNNQEHSLDLSWTALEKDQAKDLLHRAAQKVQGTPEIRSFGKDGIWISLPTFHPQDEKTHTGLYQTIEKIRGHRSKDPIVVDIRGNGGGNSTWGIKVLEAIYGRFYVMGIVREYEENEVHQWRLSDGNYDHLKNYHLPRAAAHFGSNSEVVSYIRDLLRDMRGELDQGHRGLMTVEGDWSPQKSSPPERFRDPAYSGRVLILTDSGTGSSCLTFLAYAKEIPGCFQVGGVTHASTLYTEGREEMLPSKQASLLFPAKVIRNRGRGRNEAFEPRWIYRQLRDPAAGKGRSVDLIED